MPQSCVFDSGVAQVIYPVGGIGGDGLGYSCTLGDFAWAPSGIDHLDVQGVPGSTIELLLRSPRWRLDGG